jgi:2-polyprenyl-3-methyl-5-hydroxy-6-metoxy-1,4-benzoquinol methylase
MGNPKSSSNASIKATVLPVGNKLAVQEPEFYELWLRDQDPNDPQLLRWVEMEADQIAEGEKRVAEWEKTILFKGKTILDVGCQWGATSIALARAGGIVTGIDIHSPFVEGARMRSASHGIRADFFVSQSEQMHFEANSFDVIICTNVIEHVNSHEKALKEIIRVLRPGGMLFLDGPNRMGIKYFIRDPHYRMFGVSVLSHSLGKFYVTKIRKYPAYYVGTFPVASTIGNMLNNLGVDIVRCAVDGLLSSRKNDGMPLQMPKLNHPINWLRLNCSAIFYFYGRKIKI